MSAATGIIIVGNPPIQEFLTLGFGAELMYSFVIIICSLMIYFGTKELYELSSYKGIKYFRQAFLFFAVAYFFRSFIKFVITYFNIGKILDLPQSILNLIIGPMTLFIFMYLSSMAIFYLLYSVMWKKWENTKKIYFFHALAVGIALISILFPTTKVYLMLNIFLLGFISFLVYSARKNSKLKKSHNLYVIYMLLSVFWILNIIDILIPTFLRTFQLLVYITSLGVFLTILYKVLKKTGSD
jgi:hypothetical protein